MPWIRLVVLRKEARSPVGSSLGLQLSGNLNGGGRADFAHGMVRL